MPSKSPEQARLMRAVAAGWKPTRIKGPTRAVAKEFVKADKRKQGVKGYQRGGYALGVPGMRRMPLQGGKPMPPRTGGPLSMDPRMMPRMQPTPMGRPATAPDGQTPMARSRMMPPRMSGGLTQMGDQLQQLKMRMMPPGPVTPPPRGAVPNTMYGGRNAMMQMRGRFGGGMPRRTLY